jgi:hypothetical protein
LASREVIKVAVFVICVVEMVLRPMESRGYYKMPKLLSSKSKVSSHHRLVLSVQIKGLSGLRWDAAILSEFQLASHKRTHPANSLQVYKMANKTCFAPYLPCRIFASEAACTKIADKDTDNFLLVNGSGIIC